MKFSDLSLVFWFLLGCLLAFVVFFADFVSSLLTPKLVRRFRRKKNGDPPLDSCCCDSCSWYSRESDQEVHGDGK